jgi:type I restriction enzyme S subunit
MNWPLTRLGDLSPLEIGRTPRRADSKMWDPSRETDNAWATIADLSAAEHFEICETKEHISDLGASSGKLVPKGTLLMSFKLSIGKLAYAGRPLFTNEAIVALHLPDDSPVSQRFLFHYLSSVDWEEEARGNEKVKGATLNKAKLKELMIPTPSVTDQERIVTLLDEATAAVTELEAVYSQTASKLDDLRASALAAAMASGEWPRLALKDVCTVDWGNTSLTKSAYVDGGEHLAVSAAGPDGRIDHFEHDAFTPVLSAIGAQCGRMFMPSEPFTAIKNTMTLTAIPGKVDRWFLFYLLESVELPRRGAAQPFLSKGDVQAFEVAVPQLTDQERIVAQLDEVSVAAEEALELAGARLEAAQSLRQSVLGAAFRGEF